MALQLRSLHDLPSATGTIDRRYPLGDAPVNNSSILAINQTAYAAATPVLVGLSANTTFDFNYRQFLTGTSAATAVCSVNSASGSLGNWGVDASGNGISIATGALGNSGALFVSFTTGSITVSFPVQSWSTLPVVSGGAIKLVVGNGFWLDNQFWTGSSGAPAQEQSNFNSVFPTFSADPLIKFFFMELTWGAGEGPTRGDYSKVFAAIDAVLAKLATATTKTGLILSMWIEFFNTTNITNTGQWPQYVINNNWIYATISNGQGRTQLKWDIDDVWAAYGDFCVAICNRYNNHPLFYGFCPMDETDMVTQVDNVAQPGGVLSPNQTILNASHYQAQLQALFLRILGALPNTPGYFPFNYLPAASGQEAQAMANIINAIEAQYPKHAIYGGPDPFVRQTTFQKLVAGAYQSTTGMGDIRKNILLMNRIQGAYLGNRNDANGNPINPGVTPLQIYDNAVTTNNCVMLTWNWETYMYYKATDEVAAIHTRNGAVGTPPAGGSYQII